jgi:predicted aspartyl protease
LVTTRLTIVTMGQCKAMVWRIGAATIIVAAANAAQATGSGALGDYLIKNGYGAAPLAHPVNYYHLPVRADGQAGYLTIDTGAPTSLVFRSSLKSLRLTEAKTNRHVIGAFGRASDVFGSATIRTLVAGNCTLTNVPVIVATGRGDSMLDNIRPSGVIGLRELVRYHAVLDLKNRLIYFQASPSNHSSSEIRAILLKDGYTLVPLSLADSHLQIAGSLNSVPCRVVVDTGAYLTVFSRDFVNRAGLKTIATPFVAEALGGSSKVGMVKFASLRIGNYEIRNGSATVAPLNREIFGSPSGIAGLLGAEYLGMNWAVFDFASRTMYLRPRRR